MFFMIRGSLVAIILWLAFASVPTAQSIERNSAGPAQLEVKLPNRKTFGPQKITPAGTVFHLKILSKGEHDAIRLHRCGEPCNTASTVNIWEPKSYKSGDQLSWRVDQDGMYYIWIEDQAKKKSVVASSDELSGAKLRIVFASGAIIEAWYTTP